MTQSGAASTYRSFRIVIAATASNLCVTLGSLLFDIADGVLGTGLSGRLLASRVMEFLSRQRIIPEILEISGGKDLKRGMDPKPILTQSNHICPARAQ